MAFKSIISATCTCLAAISFYANASPISNDFGLSAPVTTITFDEFIFAVDTDIDTQYSSLGVTFTPALKYDPFELANVPGALDSAGVDGHYLGNFSDDDFLLVNPFSIYFNSNQTEIALGASTGDPYLIPTTFSALLDGFVVETFTALTGYNDATIGFYGFENILFDEIQIQPIGTAPTDDKVIIDNIQFGTVSSVPVPAAVWLFGSGIIGLIGLASRNVRA